MLRFFLLAASFFAAVPASAGLFSDSEARLQIQQAEARLAIVEESVAKLEARQQQFQQMETRLAAAEEALATLDASNKQKTSSMLDMQTVIDAQNAELRKMRGQMEEFAHYLQDDEKRQKDFYVDLDGRLRRFEAVDVAFTDKTNGVKNKSDDPITENRALEAAYGFYKAERYSNAVSAFQDFLNSYPKSAHTANVRYWMGNAYFVLKDYKSSLESFQILANKYDSYPKIIDVLFNIVDCQVSLDNKDAAKATLKQIINKFPNSEAAAKARKDLATLKQS